MSLNTLLRERRAVHDSAQPAIRRWTRNQGNIKRLELRQALLGHTGCVNALCWSLDGRFLFSGSDDSTICVWQAEGTGEGSLICRLQTGFDERVFDLKILPSPNEHLLIACSMDSTIKIFDTNRIIKQAGTSGLYFNLSRLGPDGVISNSNFCIRTFAVHTAAVKRAATMPDRPYEFLTCSEDGTARLFDIREPNLVSQHSHRSLQRGGQIVASYRTIGAELHALDANPFQSSIFAVGGSMESIMVHDFRMASFGDANPASIVRLRRKIVSSSDDLFEQTSEISVTGLRFSRDTSHQVIGSWCYDSVYMFDLNQSTVYMSADSCKSTSIKAKQYRSRSTSSSSLQLHPDAKRVRLDSTQSSDPQSVSRRVGQHVRDFARGQARGVRILTEEEAPYLLNSDSPSDTTDSEDICGICKQKISDIDVGSNQLLRSGINATGFDQALSPAETGFLFLSFNSFVSSMVSSSLSQAAAAISFVIRQLEDGGTEPSEQALQDLLPLKDVQLSSSNEQLQKMLAALYTDAGLERRRVRSILYNNRACVSASIFRQKWRRVFDLGFKEAHPNMMCPHKAENIHNELEDIRSDIRSSRRDIVIATDLNRYNLLAHFNHLLLTWDTARLDCMVFALALRPLLGNDAGQISDTCSEYSSDCEVRSQARIDCLRAEFGDLSHRMGEFGSRLNSNLNTIRTLADEIGEHGNLVNRIGSHEQNGLSVCHMFHACERYFEISAKLALQLSESAHRIAGLLEQCTLYYVERNATDYLGAMNCLMSCYELLSMPKNVTTDIKGTFGQDLFPDLGTVVDSHEANHLYLWHSHLPSIRSSMENSHPEVKGLCVETIPTFPLDENIRHIDSNSHASDVSSEIGSSSSQDSSGPSFITASTDVPLDRSDDTGSSETPSPYNQHRRSSGLRSTTVPLADLSEDDLWPRETCELFPHKDCTPLTSPGSTSGGDYSSRNLTPIVLPCRRYNGHCNIQTVKDVNFVFDQYVTSGSDDGRVFIWDRDSMDIVQILRGDSEIVNNIEGHPSLPVIAVSGIDNEVYLFSLPQGGPSAVHRQNFPLVQSRQLSTAGITGEAAISEFVESVYCPDPYLEQLRLSGGSLLTQNIDYDQLTQRILRTFPAVSTSCVDDMSNIVSENEHILFDGLSQLPLTHHLMSNIMFRGLFELDDSSGDSSQESNNSDEDTDESRSSLLESYQRRSRWLRRSYISTDNESLSSSDSNSSL